MYQGKIREIQSQLEKVLKPERYDHTLGVMFTAASMAMVHECDLDKTMLAALLHDCAKCISYEEMLELCDSHGVVLTEIGRSNRTLLHSKAGAVVAKETYGIMDEEILHAISVHTTGEPSMSLLDKIVFIADYIEPGRYHPTNLPQIRKLAFTDIDACVAQISKDTLAYLNVKGDPVDTTTEETYEYYKQFRKEQ